MLRDGSSDLLRRCVVGGSDGSRTHFDVVQRENTRELRKGLVRVKVE